MFNSARNRVVAAIFSCILGFFSGSIMPVDSAFPFFMILGVFVIPSMAMVMLTLLPYITPRLTETKGNLLSAVFLGNLVVGMSFTFGGIIAACIGIV